MKVLLVQCPSIPNRNTGPPTGLGYLASYLERANHKVRIIDSIILKYTIDDIKRDLKQFDPDVLGISVTTPFFNNTKSIIEIAKEHNPNCLIVLGGPHPTVKPKETLELSPDIDVVVRGEGELTFTELVDSFENRKNFFNIRGISFQSNGRIIENIDRPLIENLDSLPFPAYHLLPMEKYKIKEKIRNIGLVGKQNQPYCTIQTIRGCPYNCSFCASRLLWGKTYRSRSPENVVEELKILRYKYGKKIIEFYDDSFTIDKQRVLKLCRLIKEEGIDISWICETRVDLFDNDIALALKNSGCKLVVFGLESGVQKSLDFLKKGIKVEDSKRAVKIAKEVGLKVGSPFMIGIPGETKEMIKTTLSFAKELNLDYNSYGLLTPLPGTYVYNLAQENNWFLIEDYSKYNFSNPVMKVPGFTKRELKGFLYTAHLNYFCATLSPSHIFKNINKLIFGLTS